MAAASATQHVVGGRWVGGLEAVGAAGFVEVAERVIREGLGRGAAAVGAGDAGEVVVSVIAGLRVRAEGIGDGRR
jgi:hypothetical protein